jgi:hypothetical protein
VIAIKWEVPIPNAPAAPWSLYQTNKADIDWRYITYGYPSWSSATSSTVNGINSAPHGRFDGQRLVNFGGPNNSDHVVNVSDNMILTAKNVPSPFTITLNREWVPGSCAVHLTVQVQASMNFTSNGPLVLRTVMVEREINFATAPGTNGEMQFKDAAIAAFPNIQNGTPLASSWTNGQSQTFTLNCTVPPTVRDKNEVALVCFIQDDGNRIIYQAARADKQPMPVDVKALSTQVDLTCTGTISPVISMMNKGTSAITSATIIPYIDGTAHAPVTWSGNIPVNGSVTTNLGILTVPNVNGSHTFSYNISAVNAGPDLYACDNGTKINFMVVDQYIADPVIETFNTGTVLPTGWTQVNTNAGPAWTKALGVGAFGIQPLLCAKYDFFNNTVAGDVDEFILPPVDLTGTQAPTFQFDYAYARRNSGNNDKLEVLASKDCGATWNSIYLNSGSAMASTTQYLNTTPFTPSFDQWVQVPIIDLSGYAHPSVLIKFVTTADKGNNLYIDNVNVIQPDWVGLDKRATSGQLSARIYPSPITGPGILEVKSVSSGKGEMLVTNTLGQQISHTQLSVHAGINNIPVDMSDFAPGIYTVIFQSGGYTAVQKISVLK